MSQFHPARTILLSVFTVAVLSLFALVHSAVGIYVYHVTNIEIGWMLWALGVSSILCWVLAHWKRNLFTHVYYLFGTFWMGIVFIAFMVFFPLLLLNRYFETGLFPLYAIPFVLALLFAGFFLAYVPKTHFIQLPLRNLRTSKHRTRLVQLTDLHIGEIYGPRHLKQVVDRVNALEPDYVVITGDLFDGAGKLYPGMIDPVHELKAKHPVLFVSGNHEVYEGVHKCVKLIRERGITVLDDQAMTVGSLHFVGLSYPENFLEDKRPVLKRLVKRLDHTKPIVLLRHEPRGIEDAAANGVDLMLSGHTHNGQIWPFSYLIRLFYRFRVGLHKLGVTNVYISPGTGTWGPPFRLGSRSEITVFELTRA